MAGEMPMPRDPTAIKWEEMREACGLPLTGFPDSDHDPDAAYIGGYINGLRGTLPDDMGLDEIPEKCREAWLAGNKDGLGDRDGIS